MHSLDTLAQAMLLCKQSEKQTVYQHGIAVRSKLLQLIANIRNGNEHKNWRIPNWLLSHGQDLVEALHPEEILSEYTLFHDCGKPLCRQTDADGKVHFPNHAEVSKQAFLDAGGNPIVANLIGWDMVLHTASSEEIGRWLNEWTTQDAATLLLTALSEIHANAELFGGIESISFKSKWKTIERRGNQICKHLFVEVS